MDAEFWGRIDSLNSSLSAERKAHAASEQRAEDAAQRLAGARSRMATMRGEQAETRRLLGEAKQELARLEEESRLLSRELRRERARLAHAEATAVGRSGSASAMWAARAFRDNGRLDLAATILAQGVYTASHKVDLFHLQLLKDMDEAALLQQALRGSIERLPESAAPTEAAMVSVPTTCI